MTNRHAIPAQFLRFAAVGGLCAGIQYLLLAMGVEWLGLGVVLASTLAYLASAAVNYLLNRRYTYGSDAPHVVLVWRFVAVLAVGLMLNALFMQVLHGLFQWRYIMAQLLAMVVVLLWNFCIHRYWTFQRRKA